MSTLEQASAITYRDALNAAMHRAMQTYPEAIVFGEDVAAPGGVFGVTRGLTEEFGDRVFDTPISETAMLGAALGAAMMGRRRSSRSCGRTSCSSASTSSSTRPPTCAG